MGIVGHYFPDAILSHRTALELKPVTETVFVTGAAKRRIDIEGLIINCIPGDTKVATQPVLPQLFRSTEARALLENLSSSRARKGVSRALGQQEVEARLANTMARQGEESLRELRKTCRPIAEALGLAAEMQKLDSIVGILLTSQPDNNMLQSRYAKAVANRTPYDADRLQLLEGLAIALQKCEFIARPFAYSREPWSSLSFFESYFSNYIEGTEFEIDEAEDIVFKRQEVDLRHEDSHDVLAVYDMVSDVSEMVITPQSAEELVAMLQSRHAVIMGARRDKRPGEIKKKINKAGNTWFVEPGNVIGTLNQGFDIYTILPEGLCRAIYMQFLIAEVHPFNDGNGRLSRIMLNAELAAVGETRIIIPTVYRDSYLNGLRLASKQQQFSTLIKVFDLMQAYTASINWSDYGEARQRIEQNAAHAMPDQGIAIFNRELRDLKRSRYPDAGA